MDWSIVVEPDETTAGSSPVFDSLVDAMLYALDLADKLGWAAPEVSGRSVHIVRDDGSLELSIAVIPNGLTGKNDRR